MKFLWISKYADTLALAIRVAEEGNEVELATLDPKRKICGQQLVKKTDDWRKSLAKDKIVVIDMVGSGNIAENLKKQGYAVFNGSALGDKLELDRVYGTEVMKTAGINTPKTESFTNFNKAIEYVKKNKRQYVFKPSGNMGCALTYVAYNDKDMVHFLDEIRHEIYKKVEFELQETVEGVEVSLEGLFNGKEWVDGWWNITLENKAEMTGGLGHFTGCSLDTVRVLPDQFNNKMVKKTLARITPLLQEADYRGLIDINCIYKDGVPFGLEWTPRFGINAIFTMLELLKDDMGKVIADTALGNSLKVKTDQYNFGASVRVCVPESPKIPHRLIQNLQSFKHIHPMDLMLDKKGDLVTCDVDFILAIVTGYGSTIPKAADMVYHILKKTDNFGINEIEYRIDGREVFNDDFQKLKSWDFIR
jgi:phosphoribosylamine--glycine ligase